jgi:hypothetical protein
VINVKSTCSKGVRTLTLEQERFRVNDPDTTSIEW